MKIGKILRTVVVSNVVLIGGLLLSGFPVMAAQDNVASQSRSALPSATLLAEINSKALQQANEYLSNAVDSLNAVADSETDTQAQENFASALDALEDAVKALKDAGMPGTAETLAGGIENLKAAVEAESDEKQDELIDAAIDALNKVAADIKKASGESS